MPDVEVHTITNITRIEDTVTWLETHGQVVAIIESLRIDYPPPRGLGAVGGVRSSIVGKMTVLFRSADVPNGSPRMAVVGNVLTYHEGQIHIGLTKSLHS